MSAATRQGSSGSTISRMCHRAKIATPAIATPMSARMAKPPSAKALVQLAKWAMGAPSCGVIHIRYMKKLTESPPAPSAARRYCGV